MQRVQKGKTKHGGGGGNDPTARSAIVYGRLQEVHVVLPMASGAQPRLSSLDACLNSLEALIAEQR